MSTAEIPDTELLRHFRDGDPAALEMLLARYEVPLFQFLLGLLQDHHRAEDALQETFVLALQRLEEVDHDHLRGWLFTVAYNQAMLVRRREKRARVQGALETADLNDPQPGPEQLAEARDDQARLAGLVAQLSPTQQEVVRQRGEGKRYADIARLLGCPLNTVLARMHEAIKRLRLLWGNEHG